MLHYIDGSLSQYSILCHQILICITVFAFNIFIHILIKKNVIHRTRLYHIHEQKMLNAIMSNVISITNNPCLKMTLVCVSKTKMIKYFYDIYAKIFSELFYLMANESH